MMKSALWSLPLALLVSCSQNTATRATAATHDKQAASADANSSTGTQSSADDTSATTSGSTTAGDTVATDSQTTSTTAASTTMGATTGMTALDGPARTECKGTLSYDPSGFQCGFVESKSNSVWKNEDYWNQIIHKMQNLDAAWIGPGPQKKKGPNNDLDYCPSVGAQYRLVHVSHFKLDAATKIKIQFVMDDKGTVEIWKNAMADKSVYFSEQTNSLNGEASLDAGFYTVIVTTIDDGNSATATIGSILNADTGAILRQTELGKNWCVFQVTAEVGIPDFLRAHGACLPCMVGDP